MSDLSQRNAAGEDLRCSVQTRGLGEFPAGSATSADHFLLVELPMPWPKSIESHPVVMALAMAPEVAASTRILGIREAEDPSLDRHRIISYRRDPNGPFDGFGRAEAEVSTNQLAPTLAKIVSGDSTPLTPMHDGVVDVLICTHGSRDRCCGQLGSLLLLEVADQVPDNIRMWRTSHTGGHRFAPTAITFPDGMTWSFLDAQVLHGILDRTIDPIELVTHTRGCAAMATRPMQVADAAAFQRAGWAWLEQPRNAVVRVVEDTGGEYEIYLDGAGRQFTVTMTEVDPVPVPPCGERLDEATKSSPQFVVTDIVEH
jgi:hypothetical protein